MKTPRPFNYHVAPYFSHPGTVTIILNSNIPGIIADESSHIGWMSLFMYSKYSSFPRAIILFFGAWTTSLKEKHNSDGPIGASQPVCSANQAKNSTFFTFGARTILGNGLLKLPIPFTWMRTVIAGHMCKAALGTRWRLGRACWWLDTRAFSIESRMTELELLKFDWALGPRSLVILPPDSMIKIGVSLGVTIILNDCNFGCRASVVIKHWNTDFFKISKLNWWL